MSSAKNPTRPCADWVAPEGLEFKPYQLAFFEWYHRQMLPQFGRNSLLCSDEMGTGKTILALSIAPLFILAFVIALSAIFAEVTALFAIVVAPSALDVTSPLWLGWTYVFASAEPVYPKSAKVNVLFAIAVTCPE